MKKDIWKRLKFRLCIKHRKCAQTVLDMGMPLCKRKCIMQTYRSINGAYWKTLEGVKP